MARTPERKVKDAVDKVLERYPESYVFKSVPFGYGPSTLDYLMCHYELFISIETKREGEVPTARQNMIIGQITRARGKHFTIDGVDKCAPLSQYLEQVKQNAIRSDQSQASPDGRPILQRRWETVPRGEDAGRWSRPSYSPAAPADGDIPVTKDGLRRSEPDTD